MQLVIELDTGNFTYGYSRRLGLDTGLDIGYRTPLPQNSSGLSSGHCPMLVSIKFGGCGMKVCEI